MPLTRAQNDQIYVHILTEILQQNEGGLLDMALRANNFTTPVEIITLTDDAIETITFDDDSDPDGYAETFASSCSRRERL